MPAHQAFWAQLFMDKPPSPGCPGVLGVNPFTWKALPRQGGILVYSLPPALMGCSVHVSG